MISIYKSYLEIYCQVIKLIRLDNLLKKSLLWWSKENNGGYKIRASIIIILFQYFSQVQVSSFLSLY